MTSKQRLLSAIRGEKLDCIPWSPNLAYWWEDLYTRDSTILSSEVLFLKNIGADPLIRGHYPLTGNNWEDMVLFDLKYKNSAVFTSVKGDLKQITYETPVGKLEFIYKLSSTGDTWFLTKHGIKNEEDFKVLQYLKEDTVLTPNYKRYEEESKKYGEDALLVPILCPESKSFKPFLNIG